MADDDTFEFVLRKRGTGNRKRVGGFTSVQDAAAAARRMLEGSAAFDDFRVYVEPGGDVEFD